MKKVLIMEDEANIRSFVVINLKRAGYDIIEAASGEEALEKLKRNPDIKVALLDVMLPKMIGFDVCRTLRDKGNNVPVIILTAREEEADKVLGLEIGADDYISKPFSVAEVMARVRSVLRRTKRLSTPAPTPATTVEQPQEQDDVIRFEKLSITNNEKICRIDGEEILLTRKEYDILVLLLSNKGRILSREQIMKRVWSEEVVVLDRTIDVNITRLRKKLGFYGKHIKTRTGYGDEYTN